MGWSYRRRVTIAPGVALNVSKSGLSWSLGGAPFTVNVGKRGVYQTFSIPGTGFSHRTKIGAGGRAEPRDRITPDSPAEEIISQVEIKDTTDDQLLEEINARAAQPGFLPWTALASIILAFVNPAFLLVGAPACLWAFNRDRRIRTTVVNYQLAPDAEARYERMRNAVEALAKTRKVWYVQAERHEPDWKRNAGAMTAVRKAKVFIQNDPFLLIKSNVTPKAVTFGRDRIYFFPDRVIFRRGRRYGACSYADLSLEASSTEFVEAGLVPSDATVVGRTWRYVRKDGGPDLRFSGNAELPLVRYGVLELAAGDTMRVRLMTSRLAAPQEFAAAVESMRDGEERGSESREAFSPAEAPGRSAEPAALALLGLRMGATRDEIDVAYKEQAKLYHPDKVAHLGPEIREVAERKMKEINEAYAVLVTRR